MVLYILFNNDFYFFYKIKWRKTVMFFEQVWEIIYQEKSISSNTNICLLLIEADFC